MSAVLVCPDCGQRLRVPETATGKAFRCPSCTAVIPASSEPEVPSSRAVKSALSSRTAPPVSRRRAPREGEPEDDFEPAEESISERSSRKRRARGKKSSTGLILGLAAAVVVVVLVVLGGGATAIWLVLHNRGKPIAEAEWQTFSPPNSDCSVLMPGIPQPQPLTVLGITINKYLLTRTKEKAFFAVAYANLGPDPLQPNALDVMANAERDHLLRTLKCTVAGETATQLGALPGRELQIATQPRGTYIERMYLAKIGGIHRLYLVVVGGDNLTATHADVARFFDSFKIDGSAIPPTYLGAAMPVGLNPNPPALVNPPPMPPQFQPPIIPRPRLPRQPRPGP